MSQHRIIYALFGFILSAIFVVTLAFVPSAGTRVAQAAGAIWTVNNLGDSGTTTCSANAGAGGPVCQLRDAIGKAQNGDTIQFSVTGTITLNITRGTLAININLTISGPGASALTIDGNKAGGGTFSIFKISGGIVTISGLTIQNGYNPGSGSSLDGGAIHNDGILTISNSILSGNSAGFYDGGAIYSDGTLTVSDSLIQGNFASQGGGITNDNGKLTISSSVFAGNMATNGGAIDNSSGSLLVSNSTFSGNYGEMAGAGIRVSYGSVTVSNSTFSGNSGDGIGISGGSLYLLSTIVAQNTVNDINANPLGATNAVITTLGYNLIGNGTGDGFTPISTDKVGTSANPINALLGALANYGGPLQTIVVPINSPAYQAGNCAGNASANPPAPAVTQDQRGQNRKATCDIGAFEETFTFTPILLPNGVPGVPYSQTITASGGVGPYIYQVTAPGGLPPGMTLSSAGVLSGTPTGNRSAAFTVDATDGSDQIVGAAYYTFTANGPVATWTVNVNTDNGLATCQRNGGADGPPCELRDALYQAGNGDTINFANGLSSPILLNTSLGTLNINFNLTITGSGASNLAVDGNKAGGAPPFAVLTENNNVTASISGLTIQNGSSGGISNKGILIIDNSVVSASSGGSNIGGIYNLGTLTIRHSTVSDNDFNQIYNSGTLNVLDSTLIGSHGYDTSLSEVYNNGGVVSLIRSAVLGSPPYSQSNGIDNFSGQITIVDSTIANNCATEVLNQSGTISISNSTIANTYSLRDPPSIVGISNIQGSLTISNSTVANNTYGVGIDTVGGVLNLQSDIIAKNGAYDIYDHTTVATPTIITTLGHNLIGDGTNDGLTPGPTDEVGTSANPIDPLFGPLAANGGPTQTMALPINSPAYKTGNCSGSTTVNPPVPAVTQDQRGQSRKATCDVGALEETFTFTPNTLLRAIIGTAYSQGITANGGSSPYSFALSGMLPSGLSLTSAGSLVGTPTQTGTFNLTVTATDTNGVVGSIYYTLQSNTLDTIGVFRSGKFYLRLHNSTGYADMSIAFTVSGKPYPVVGDWVGQGFDTVGVFNQNNGQFSLRNSNTPGTPDEQFVLGKPNDIPLSGKWSASATHAGVGVFRPSNGLIYLKNNLTTGFADDTMVLGIPGDVGLAGDWSSKGYDSPGVYRPSNSNFYLSNQDCNCSVYADIQFAYGIGGDAPVAGDWIAQGHDGVGLFRQSNGYTYLRNGLTTGYADNAFTYGIAGDVPIAGHWQLTYPPKPNATAPINVLVSPTAAPVQAGAAPGNGLDD